MTLKDIAHWLQNSGNAVRDRSTTNWNTFEGVKEPASTARPETSTSGEREVPEPAQPANETSETQHDE